MNMMANEKSKAEQYRDERKARIAKTAKKNAKNMEKTNTAKKVAGKVVAIVLAAAVVITALGFSLSYYGVPQRLTTIGKVGSDQRVSVAEYEYYYMQAYNQLTYYAQYYKYYGYDYGYDTTLTPEAQTKTTKDKDGNEITWVEYLHESTISMAQMYKAYYNEAVKAGLSLDDADKANIDKTIKDYKDKAESAGSDSSSSTTTTTSGTSKTSKVRYSLNAYLRKIFGGAVNERFLRKQLKIQTLAQKYYQSRTKDIAAGYSQDVIDKTYNDDKDTYDMVDFRFYKFASSSSQQTTTTTDTSTEDAATIKKNAEDFYAAVKDNASFVAEAKSINSSNTSYDADKSTKSLSALKADIKSNYTEDIANWLFDSSTKVGDKKLFSDSDSGTYYVILLTQAKHQTDTVTVRHILFKTVDDSNNALSEDQIAKAKQNAEDALKTWQDGDKTEDSFAALANKLSEDTGSNTNGGLYENQRPGQTVDAYNDWIFDASRQTGDVEIIQTEYGYHVMYFVSKGGKYYDSAIRSSKANEDISTEASTLLDGDEYQVGFGPRRLNYAESSVLKKITNLVELNNANSSKSSSSSSSGSSSVIS
jgi:hypothetical protein